MRRLLLVALLLVLPLRAGATVLIPIEFRELVSISSTVVHGRVVDVRGQWVDGRRAIETFVTVEADEYYKGGGAGTVTVRVPGGQIGRFRTIVVGAPEFQQGDEVVLFLRSYADRVAIVGLSQGAYRVVADRSGRRIVTSPVLMGTDATGTATAVVRGDVTRRALAVDAFRDLVKRVLAGGVAQ
jgi:hypothetical protein